jgi:FkbM family methyltransferase
MPFSSLLVDSMASPAQLLKRGWRILSRDGVSALASRSLSFIKYVAESEYYGRKAKRHSPIDYHGVSPPLDMPVFDNRVRHAFMTGSYEASEVELMDKHVAGPYDIVDLGASTGFSTAYALGRVGDGRRAVAVEANPAMIGVIRAVQELNDAHFAIEQSAYQPERSEVTFHVHGKTVSGSTKQVGESEITVPAVDLDSLLSKHDIDEFVCLADIEGGEIDLFRHELALLEESCALLIVELHEFDGIDTESKQLLSDSVFERIDNVGDVYVYRNES